MTRCRVPTSICRSCRRRDRSRPTHSLESLWSTCQNFGQVHDHMGRDEALEYLNWEQVHLTVFIYGPWEH